MYKDTSTMSEISEKLAISTQTCYHSRSSDTFIDNSKQILLRSTVCVADLENIFTAHKKKTFPIKNLFSKCDQICSFLRIWSYLLKKSLIENFFFCAMFWSTQSCYSYNFGIFILNSDYDFSEPSLALSVIFDTPIPMQ